MPLYYDAMGTVLVKLQLRKSKENILIVRGCEEGAEKYLGEKRGGGGKK